MAQTGYTPIQLYYSTTASAVPTNTNLANGELAINITDGKLYYKDNTGTVKLLAGTGGAGIAAGSNTQIQFNSSGSFGASSSLTFDGTTFSAPNSVITSSSSSDALRITQTGTGNAILVEDSANPDSTPFVVDQSGNVGIGTSVPNVYGAQLVLAGSASTTPIVLSRNSTADANSSTWYWDKERSGAIVQNGDVLGTFRFRGFDGTSFTIGAQIRADVDGTPGTNDMPGRLVFSTTADGASTPTERMRITSTGSVGIGGAGGADRTVGISKAITGGTSAYGIVQNGAIQSDVTTLAQIYRSGISTAASAFTLGSLVHYVATTTSIGAGSTVTNQFGYVAESSLTGATNNYGFYGNIASGTGRYNLYMAGTAENFFGGNTVISVTDNTNAALRVTQLGTGNALLVEDSTNPDATPTVITADGRVVVGYTSAITGAGANTSALQTHSTSVFQMGYGGTYWAADATGAGAYLAKSRGATIGTRGIVSNGDSTGRFSFAGDDGTSFLTTAFIESAVDGTPGTNDMPGRLVFSTTADGAAAPTERFRIASNGAWGLAGANYGSAGQVLTSNGSGSAPTWQAGGGGGGGTPGGSNTQVQYNSSGSFAGSANMTFDGTGITTGRIILTSSATPATGIYLPSSTQIAFTSYDSTNVLQLKRFQIGSTGVYRSQVTIAGGINTATAPVHYVQGENSTNVSTYVTNNTDTSLYALNDNTPFTTASFVNHTSGYSPSMNVCNVGTMAYTISQGNTFSVNVTGAYRKFPAIGVYSQADGQVGNTNGTCFYGSANPVYTTCLAYYARIAPGITSGQGHGYQVDCGPHPFGSGSIGFYSRIVSGLSGSYNNVQGWFHNDETTSGSTYAAYFQRGGSGVGSITLSTSNTTYNTSSDPRLKNVTGVIAPDEAKSFVMALQPKKGTWKVDGSYFLGFLSTDYETIDPKAVSGVAGASEIRGTVFDDKGDMLVEDVVQPPADKLPEGGRWEETHVKEIYQTLEYGSAAWCANMTAHAQYLQNTIDQLIGRISALENK